MAERSGILELYLNNEKVDEVRVFGWTDVMRNITELKKCYNITENTKSEFWLVYKSSMGKKEVIK